MQASVGTYGLQQNNFWGKQILGDGKVVYKVDKVLFT